MITSGQVDIIDGDRYFSGKSDNGTMIYIGPITRNQLQDAEVVGVSTGYYLCEFDVSDPIGGLDVLASFTTIESAYRFAVILGLSEIDGPITDFEDPLGSLSGF
ncbi:MAG: hypothetical protein WD767_12805 [Alphaproteobacteria bacterium]